MVSKEESESARIALQVNAETTVRPPKDTHNRVYCSFIAFGFFQLLPWCFFILGSPSYLQNYTFDLLFDSGTNGYASLSFYMILAFLTMICIGKFYNYFRLIVKDSTNEKKFLMKTIIVSVALYLLILILGSSSEAEFEMAFICNIFLACTINFLFGIYQGKICYLTSKFPLNYINAINIGSSASLIFVAIICIVEIYCDIQICFPIFFINAIIMSGIVLIPLANMKKDKFFKFYSKLSNDDQSRPMLSAGGNNHEAPKEHMHMFAHMKIARNSINLFMINFVTFACFPSILNEIEPSQESASYYLIVPKNCFSVVTTFLVFGIFMLLGNILANHIKINEKIVWIPSVARILFIPFFFFCNYRTNVRTFPVFVTNQWILISTVGLFGISGGYLSSLSITYSTKTVSLSKSHVVFMLTSFIGSLGTVIGYIFTSTLIDIIDNCGPLTALQLSGKPIIETIANVTELITSNVTEIINVNNISDAINTTMQTTINSTLL